jgi:hypothetical protein
MKRRSRRAQKGYFNDKQNKKKEKEKYSRYAKKKIIINTAEKKER